MTHAERVALVREAREALRLHAHSGDRHEDGRLNGIASRLRALADEMEAEAVCELCDHPVHPRRVCNAEMDATKDMQMRSCGCAAPGCCDACGREPR